MFSTAGLATPRNPNLTEKPDPAFWSYISDAKLEKQYQRALQKSNTV